MKIRARIKFAMFSSLRFAIGYPFLSIKHALITEYLISFIALSSGAKGNKRGKRIQPWKLVSMSHSIVNKICFAVLCVIA